MAIKWLAHKREAASLAVFALLMTGFIAPARHGWGGDPEYRPAVMPTDSAGILVFKAATKYPGAKILVSTEDRWLWLVEGKDTLLSAPVAIGLGTDFEYNGRKYNF